MKQIEGWAEISPYVVEVGFSVYYRREVPPIGNDRPLIHPEAFQMNAIIFLDSYNELSRRWAIFEDNADVAYLYLMKSGSQELQGDAVAYSRGTMVDELDLEMIAETGDTPLLQRDLASSTAIIPNPREEEFTLRWSADGQAVALLRNGEPLAFVAVPDERGYSKAVRESCFYANPWDEKRFRVLFGDHH